MPVVAEAGKGLFQGVAEGASVVGISVGAVVLVGRLVSVATRLVSVACAVGDGNSVVAVGTSVLGVGWLGVGVKVGIAVGNGVRLAPGVLVTTFGTRNTCPALILDVYRQFASISWATVTR